MKFNKEQKKALNKAIESEAKRLNITKNKQIDNMIKLSVENTSVYWFINELINMKDE